MTPNFLPRENEQRGSGQALRGRSWRYMLGAMNYNLTPKQAKFTQLAFKLGNLTEAYKQAYAVEGMTQATISHAASELHAHPEVVRYTAQLQADAAYVAQLDVAWVLRRYMQIATADPRELIEARRVCCRHCWGVGHAYQWIDEREWAERLAYVLDANARRQAAYRGKPDSRPPDDPLPTLDGGVGFWGVRAPHPECPQCFGKGSVDVHIADSRDYSEAAALLYAGVKTTQHGVEVKMRDQDGALAFLAKYLGLDKKTLELTGKDGAPIQSVATLTNDPVEAAKIYAQIVGGKP
jgi:phage terminase small subunit